MGIWNARNGKQIKRQRRNNIMAQFNVKHQDLGTVRSGEKMTVIFPYEGLLQLVGDNPIISSCGCSVAKPDVDNKQIKVTYTPPVLGVHPMTKERIKSQDTTKQITINEITGQTVLTVRSVTIP